MRRLGLIVPILGNVTAEISRDWKKRRMLFQTSEG